MNQQLTKAEVKKSNNGSLLLGTGLVVASMVLVPALAVRLGLGASLTGALRIALMKASNRAVRGTPDASRPAWPNLITGASFSPSVGELLDKARWFNLDVNIGAVDGHRQQLTSNSKSLKSADGLSFTIDIYSPIQLTSSDYFFTHGSKCFIFAVLQLKQFLVLPAMVFWLWLSILNQFVVHNPTR